MSEIRVNNFKGEDGISAPSFPNGINVTGIVTATTLNSTTNNVDVDDFISVGSNIHLGNAGVVTATTFVGNLTGNPTGTLQTAAQPNITSVGTLSSLNVSGNVSVGGTLTYEDVTNVDSVGLITARSGLVSPYADIDDFISVGSNIHLGNAGVVTATTFSGSGASLTNLNGSNIASGTVPTARLGSGTANNTTFLRGDSTFQTVNTDLVSDTSPQLGGSLDCQTFNIDIGDSSGSSSGRLKFGNGDTQMYHSGSHSYIKHTGTGNFYIDVNTGDTFAVTGEESETIIQGTHNGSVQLYHNGSNRLQTESWGTRLYGDSGGDTLLQIQASASRTAELRLIGNNAGNGNPDYSRITKEASNGSVYFQNLASGSWASNLVLNNNGSTDLFYSGSKKLETTSTGVTVTGTVSDTKGPLRRLPMNAQGSNYTLVASDAGKFIRGGGGNITVPYNVFSTGDMVTIMNDTGGNFTIIQGSNFSLINSADASTGTRTLAQRGLATILFNAQNQGYISGSGLS